MHVKLKTWAQLLERWLSLTQDYAKLEARFFALEHALEVTKYSVEPLLRDTKNVTLSNA